jgi:hydrophobic/amphiphilic exporter-1 (mainly G- bacteria), HAE1 family
VGTNPTAAPRIVRLSQVADVVPSTGPNQINRRDLNREVNRRQRLSAAQRRGGGRHPQRARRHRLPPGYRYSFGGSTKNMQESFAYAVQALALAWSSST